MPIEARDTYVFDAHALYWYWLDDARLGAAASAAYVAVEDGDPIGIAPTIALAEVLYVARKLRRPLSMADILNFLDGSPGLQLEPYGRVYLAAMDRFPDIHEMHDRLIAAVALVHNAIVVTRAEDIRSSRHVRTVW